MGSFEGHRQNRTTCAGELFEKVSCLQVQPIEQVLEKAAAMALRLVQIAAAVRSEKLAALLTWTGRSALADLPPELVELLLFARRVRMRREGTIAAAVLRREC